MAALPPVHCIEVFHSAEIALARRTAKQLAETLGFYPLGCEEIALAISELASNLVKHAGGGKLVLSLLDNATRRGLQIESIDTGKGIPNVSEAMADGYSTTGSLGNGLGAVNRLMDEFDISSRLGVGTRIVCCKWVREDKTILSPCPFDIGVASRPKPGFDQNGDDFLVKHWAGNTLVAVIDGLGHGELAHAAAVTARNFLESHYDQSLKVLFRGTEYACRGTRGCVMALARLDWEREFLTFASIGNIEARAFGCSSPINFIPRRGIVGVNAPDPLINENAWGNDCILVLHSDGVSSRWNWRDYPELAEKPAALIAQTLLRSLANPSDDATILIVKPTNR